MLILDMAGEVCTSCTLALNGTDDGERYISLHKWRKYACVERIVPHIRFRTCGVAFVIRLGHTCGRHVSI